MLTYTFLNLVCNTQVDMIFECLEMTVHALSCVFVLQNSRSFTSL